jgi:hypothetical protein
VSEPKKKARRAVQLPLPAATVKALLKAGIRCRPVVALGYQNGARRYVIRGVESGGAVSELGHYVAFCGLDGQALPWLQPVQSVGGNGPHAVVVAPSVVSVEMFRVAQTYELLIAAHEPQTPGADGTARLRSEVLFRGKQGHLSLELWGRDRAAAGQIAPEFFTRSGERNEIPSPFVAVVKAVTRGATCIGCDQAQYAVAPEGAASEAEALPADKAAT